MKSLFLLSIILLTLSKPAAAKDFNFEVPYLTHEEFVNLYEADQREYIILLRKAAADLSYEDQLSVFQRFNFQAPIWAAIFSQPVSAEPAPASVAQINSKVDHAKQLAEMAIHKLTGPRPTLFNRAMYSVGWGERPVEEFFSVNGNPLNDKTVAVFNALRARSDAVAAISQPGTRAERERLRMRLKSTEPTFVKLREEFRKFTDNKVKREEFDRYVLQYNSLFCTPIFGPNDTVVARVITSSDGKCRLAPEQLPAPAVTARAGARPAGVLEGIVGPMSRARTRGPRVPEAVSVPARTAATSPRGQCVRCIYAGFVISNNEKCEPVSSGEAMTKQVGPLKFPPPLTADDMNCEGAKPVMCNPLLFGLKDNGPLCVGRSASATRTCMAAAGTGAETTETTMIMIRDNKPAYDNFKVKIGNICKNVGTQCYSAARRNDIRQTCAAIRESALAFAGRMRTYNPAEDSSPGGGSSRRTPVRQLR